MSSQNIPLRCLTVPALAYHNAIDKTPSHYASSSTLKDSTTHSLSKSPSSVRSHCTITKLPPLPSHSPPSIPKGLPSNINYCQPLPSSVLHWTKTPEFDNISCSSIESVQVGSLMSNDTDTLDPPFASILHLLPQTKPLKQYALAPRFPTRTGKEDPLRLRIRKLLDGLPYTRVRFLQLDIPSKMLLEFKYSSVEAVDYEFTFDPYCYEDESIELGRAVRIGGFFNEHYEYRFVALLNVVNLKLGQVLLLALDKEKGYIGVENPVFPPIILNIPLRYISSSLLHTYASPTLFFYKALTRIQGQCCN